MWKGILATLFVLFGVSAVFALRSTSRDALAELAAAAPLHSTTAHPSHEAFENFEVNSSAKADRLPVVVPGDEAKKVVLEPVQVSSSQAQAAKAPITSWHWHAGSSKITRK
ncbi:hypothetical protein [Bradyrhizobium sp.]|jgi:hypothetical protein|uniref:hypothetical protein n=1 Tax=Bradyrhizobium sp. TaxID=376 RepID=UPI003C166F55